VTISLNPYNVYGNSVISRTIKKLLISETKIGNYCEQGDARGWIFMPIEENVWDRELRPIKIDKSQLKKDALRYRMGSVRLAMGRVVTKEEFESDKTRILALKLS